MPYDKKPAKKLNIIKTEGEKTQTVGANKLSKLVSQFSRIIAFVLILVVTGVALIVFYGTSPKPKHCTTEACFEPSFINCTQATLDHAIQPQGTIQFQTLYSDMRSGGCFISVVYIDNSNHSLNNKPMVCVFNNKVSLNQAASTLYSNLLSGQNSYDCTGPLVSIIQAAGGH